MTNRPTAVDGSAARPVAHEQFLEGQIALVFAVQEAQRVAFEPSLAVFGELWQVRAVVVPEALDVCTARCDVVERPEPHTGVSDSKHGVEAPEDRDYFSIDERVGGAEDLAVELGVLPVAALLRPVVPEHLVRCIQAHGLGPAGHPVFLSLIHI